MPGCALRFLLCTSEFQTLERETDIDRGVRYIEKPYRLSIYRHDKDIFENINIDIDIVKDILENIDIDLFSFFRLICILFSG